MDEEYESLCKNCDKPISYGDYCCHTCESSDLLYRKLIAAQQKRMQDNNRILGDCV